jgi:hypothetical protein
MQLRLLSGCNRYGTSGLLSLGFLVLTIRIGCVLRNALVPALSHGIWPPTAFHYEAVQEACLW